MQNSLRKASPWNLGAAALLLLAAGLSAAQITEFPLSQPNSRPLGITLGPDGNIWFTEQGANQIGRLTPAGVLTEFPVPTAGSGPSYITAGPDGNLWFTEHGVAGNKIGRITPGGVITEFPLPTPDSRPNGITVGPDGALWFTELNGLRVGRITTSGQITEFPLKISLARPHGITVGSDGNLWITILSEPTIVRMTLQGSLTSFTVSPAFPSPTDDAFEITPGPDGDLWFTNRISRAVGKITTDGVLTRQVVMVPGLPYGITRGPDGAIWFTQGDRISEISPRLGLRDFATGGDNPGYIAAGSDGAMWVTGPEDNKVLRVQFAVVVNDDGDDLHAAGCAATGQGTCTLRDALTWSNAQPGPETIQFAIPGPGVRTITPTSALPEVNDVILDGTTQPGYAGLPLIELDGTSAGPVSGLVVTGGSVAIRGFIVNRFGGDGIRLDGFSRNVVQGNFVGTNAAGTAGAMNSGAGIRALADVDNLIGGSTALDRNVISSNLMHGILMRSNTRVLSNYIGLDRTGTVPLGNGGAGVFNDHGSHSVVGGATAIPGTPPGNLISANGGAGIHSFVFSGGSTGQITVQGNWIGMNTAGKAALGNAGAGIHLQGVRDSVVGGPEPGARNVITGNVSGVRLGDGGVQGTRNNVITGNFIGTDVSGSVDIGNLGCGVFISWSAFSNRIGEAGTPNRIAFNGAAGVCTIESLDNTISGNSIHSNGGLGIDLAPFGVTANDPCDADSGANRLQNHPILTSVGFGASTTIVGGVLESAPSTAFRLEFFRNEVCDPAGSGEGLEYLGFVDVVTDASCRASFSAVLPVSVGPNGRVTATATDPAGNTSEFSPCFSAAGLKFSTVAPCRVADTRQAAGSYGGPSLAAGTTRTFFIAGRCGIPAGAGAIAANLTVVGAQAAGHVVVFPANQGLPATSTVNYRAGQDRANNAIVVLDRNEEVSVSCAQPSGTVDFILDVVGYFD